MKKVNPLGPENTDAPGALPHRDGTPVAIGLYYLLSGFWVILGYRMCPGWRKGDE